MGGSISFTAGVDSPSTPGQKSILSDAIEGVPTADHLLDAIEHHVRDGKTADNYEASFKVTEEDGGFLVHQYYSFDGQDFQAFSLYKIDRAIHEVQIQFFPNKVLYERSTCPNMGCIKVLSDPIRVEFWVFANEVRTSGPIIKAVADGILQKLEAQVDTHQDRKGIDDPSKFSVVSDPIEDKPVDADSFLDAFKKLMIEGEGCTEQEDGTLLEVRSGGGLWGAWGSSAYAKITLNKAENCASIHEYGTDSARVDLKSVTHLKVHSNPFRLELWNDQLLARRASDDELKLTFPKFDIQAFCQDVLKGMSS